MRDPMAIVRVEVMEEAIAEAKGSAVHRSDNPLPQDPPQKTTLEEAPSPIIYWTTEGKGPWQPIGDTSSGREWALRRGAMFFTCTRLSHEFVEGAPEPHRWGDIPFDFDDAEHPENALTDLRKLILDLHEQYELSPGVHELYASGGKGFHDIIPAEVFGAEDGDPYLPLIYKRIIATWKVDWGLTTLDAGIYNMKRGRMFRIPNVRRPNGRYKVPLKLEEVAMSSIDALLELTTAPRDIAPTEIVPTRNEKLAKLYSDTREQIHREQTEGVKGTPLTPEERAKLREKYGIAGSEPLSEEQRAELRESLPACIKAILSIDEKPSEATYNYNRLLLVVIGFFQAVDVDYEHAVDICQDFVERYPSKTYGSPELRWREFKAKWVYLDNNDSYHFACSYVRGLKLPKDSFDCTDCPLHKSTRDAMESVIAELNALHAVVFNGRCHILTESNNQQTNRPDIVLSSHRDLKTFYANRKIRIEGPKGGVTWLSPVDLWLESRDRREYKQIVFEPGGDLPGCYNLWKGFAAEPKKGDWSLFQYHLREVICSGNPDHYQYLLAWMAHAVQQPGGERPGVSIVLRGKQGTGKGCFAEGFGRIFGNHYVHVANQRHFTGNFNFHLKDCLLLHADEAFWAGSKSDEGMLKYLITEPFLAIEPKGKDVFQVRNHIRLIISSNNPWVIPAGLEERRFFVLDVSDKHRQDHKYFRAVHDQMEHGGTEAMLHDLLGMDLSGVNLREAPRTAALFEQILHSMDGVSRFWFERLNRGAIDYSTDTWPPVVVVEELYQAYEQSSRAAGDRYPHSDAIFGKRLRELCPGITIRRESVEVYGRPKRKRVYVLPPLEECRKAFESATSYPIVWAEIDES